MTNTATELTAENLDRLVANVRMQRPGQFSKDFNEKLIEVFRANGGVVPGELSSIPLILITMVGAKSGKERTVPLAFVEMDDRLFIVASSAGAPENPVWYNNLVKNPLLTVEIRADTYRAEAVSLPGEERDDVFSRICAQNAAFADYQSRTARKIPVVELRRLD
jgi:deazaflavin-dependent oxidoreductase (nitroreductase family)